MEEKIFDADFFQKLNTIRLLTKKKMNSGMSGERKSSAKGSSVEFSDFREYILGDDIRRIDWNAYGRMDKFYVKLFMEEKEGRYHIFLDSSKSMDYGVQKKSITALRITGLFSYWVLNQLDRLYLYFVKEGKAEGGRGRTGKQAFQKILNQLKQVSFEKNAGFAQAVLSTPFPSSGITVLISDFFEIPQLEEILKYLTYKKQEIMLVHILAKEEVNPSMEGMLEFIDSETSDHLKVTITNQVFREYHKTLKRFQEQLAFLTNKYELKYIPVVTGESIDQFIRMVGKG